MRQLLCLYCVLVPFQAVAVDKEAVFERMTQQGYKLEDLRTHYETGCDSGVQGYMNLCTQYRLTLADMDLEETYQELMNRLDAEHKERLMEAQKSWLSFKEATCAFESQEWFGGSGYAMLGGLCSERTTRVRTTRLKEYLSCTTTDTPMYACNDLGDPR